MIIIAGHFSIAPEEARAVRPIFLEVMRATRAEPGCLEYRFTEDLEEPGRFSIFERWQDEAALRAHAAAPHMATFRQQVSAFTLRERSLIRYLVSGQAPLG